MFDEVDTLSGDQGLERLQEISNELWDKHQYEVGEADRVVLSVELEAQDSEGNLVWKKNNSVDAAGNEKGSAMGRLVSLNVAIAIDLLVKGKLQKGVSAAPHDPSVIKYWLNELSALDETVF